MENQPIKMAGLARISFWIILIESTPFFLLYLLTLLHPNFYNFLIILIPIYGFYVCRKLRGMDRNVGLYMIAFLILQIPLAAALLFFAGILIFFVIPLLMSTIYLLAIRSKLNPPRESILIPLFCIVGSVVVDVLLLSNFANTWV